MLKEKFNHDNPGSINQKFREKRFRFFKSLLNTLPRPISILDVGGTEKYWEMMNFADEKDVYFTVCNLSPQHVTRPNFQFVVADATNLVQYKDKQFDIVYSNSVIEHLFTWDNQVKMANEVRRVGKNYFVQTPNLYFPLEPHWLFPFWQFLPYGMRVYLTQHYNIGGYPKTNDKAKARERVSEVRLLTLNEMKKLFPDGAIYEEKFLAMTKSICLYKF